MKPSTTIEGAMSGNTVLRPRHHYLPANGQARRLEVQRIAAVAIDAAVGLHGAGCRMMARTGSAERCVVT